MQNKDFKVDFIGIGTSRSASTWIYECLREHPQICMSRPKETQFFNRNYEKELKWYYKRFQNCSSSLIKGEYSPGYFASLETPLLIKKHFPDAKLILCLRNPIERAYSHYFLSKIKRKIPPVSFEQILNNPYYKQYRERLIKPGFYYSHLTYWLKIFPRDQILILFYEDIKANPLKFIQNTYQFLDVDSQFSPPSIFRRITVLKEPKINFLNFYNLNYTKKFLNQRSILKPIIKILKFFKIGFFLKRALRKNYAPPKTNLVKPKMESTTQEYLYQIYYEDIKNLEKLINKDLSFWK